MLATLFLIAAPAATALLDTANPLSKTIELLDSLSAKITAEGEAEAKAYKEYVEWCDDAASNLKYEIKTGEAKKGELEATIQKTTADIEAADSKIEDLAGAISADEKELAEATAVREKEAADFAASESELVDAIDTLDRAVMVLEKEMKKNPAAFAQVDTSNMNNLIKALGNIIDAAAFPATDQKKLVALVQAHQGNDSDDDDFGAPAAAVYKSHSNGIFDVLEDLKEKAEGQLSDLRKAESATKHNFDMLKQSLTDQIEADTKDSDEEKANKAATQEAKATAEGDLVETTKDLENDKAGLATAGSTCMTVAADHEATMKSRAEELKALSLAKKALSETTSGAVGQSYSFLQVTSNSALQTRTDLANAEIVNLVKKLAKENHSTALAQLASRIAAAVRYGSAAGEDPFAKVKELIQNMVTKLESEAKSESNEKDYCDDELAKTKAKKEELDYEISKLTTKVDKAASDSAGLKADVKELQSELAKLSKSQAEMDRIRSEQHSAYVQAKEDLELGLQGVRKALGVLRDYYGGAAAGASMLQGQDRFETMMEQPAMPEGHSKAEGAGGSIIGMLEVVESDFAKDLATEETEEADSEAEYSKTTQTNKVTKTIKEQDVKYKTKEFKSLDKTVTELSGDKETTATELSAVQEYDAKLKERCIAKPETYEQRKARREAEISGLREALSILENEVAFTQHGKKHHHFLANL
jgi:DNA repair exonuclease SbcCD ATPase subunit